MLVSATVSGRCPAPRTTIACLVFGTLLLIVAAIRVFSRTILVASRCVQAVILTSSPAAGIRISAWCSASGLRRRSRRAVRRRLPGYILDRLRACLLSCVVTDPPQCLDPAQRALWRLRGDRLVGGLSGGERQSLAIARAVYFGARVLILDEPTAALGVKQSAHVLRIVNEAKRRGLAVIFITHQVMHAMAVGDHFAVLIRGSIAADFRKGERSREEIADLMAGGESMVDLEASILADGAVAAVSRATPVTRVSRAQAASVATLLLKTAKLERQG